MHQTSKYKLTSVIFPLTPGFVPISEQAALFGRDIPVEQTASAIRAAGFKIDPSIPDHAILKEEPNSPTGYAFSFCGFEQVAVWSLVI